MYLNLVSFLKTVFAVFEPRPRNKESNSDNGQVWETPVSHEGSCNYFGVLEKITLRKWRSYSCCLWHIQYKKEINSLIWKHIYNLSLILKMVDPPGNAVCRDYFKNWGVSCRVLSKTTYWRVFWTLGSICTSTGGKPGAQNTVKVRGALDSPCSLSKKCNQVFTKLSYPQLLAEE